MALSTRFLNTILLALACTPYARAHPSTHFTRSVGVRGLEVETFHPASTYETFGTGVVSKYLKRSRSTSLEGAAISIVAERTGHTPDEISFKSGYTTASGGVAYVRQTHDGIEFANSAANVAIKDNKLVAFGTSFIRPTDIAPTKPSIPITDAIKTAEELLHGKLDSTVEPKLEYLVKEDHSAVLTHVLRISNEEDFTFYEAFINAHTGAVESVVDFVNHATYRVVPISQESVAEGQEDLANPQDVTASPIGWHTPATGTLKTAGNNMYTLKSISQSGPDEFLYTYDLTQEPSTTTNFAASTVNAFYIVNTVHDILYRYGFTEAAFNFQGDNFGKGGQGKDSIKVVVQDSSGTNNANFATLPDGQEGRLRLYRFDLTTPNRDAALQNDITVHEVTHGLTNRLVGGGTASCLQTTESGGMGEGWSDAFAEWTQQRNATIVDWVTGKWVLNRTSGVRTHPYSTNPAVNPLTYGDLKTLDEVHRIGEVWANMLHNVYAALIGAYGFSSTAKTNPDGKEGNVVYLHLFVDSLSLMPCNPTFVQARSAWIQADVNRYGGANGCLLWKVFASRGLGVNADGYVNDRTVPAGC